MIGVLSTESEALRNKDSEEEAVECWARRVGGPTEMGRMLGELMG